MNKASGYDGIPVELFQILKEDVVKVLHSTCQEIWKTQHWPQGWKRSVFIPCHVQLYPKTVAACGQNSDCFLFGTAHGTAIADWQFES